LITENKNAREIYPNLGGLRVLAGALPYQHKIGTLPINEAAEITGHFVLVLDDCHLTKAQQPESIQAFLPQTAILDCLWSAPCVTRLQAEITARR
jgi:hypothetical protein